MHNIYQKFNGIGKKYLNLICFVIESIGINKCFGEIDKTMNES